MGSGASSQNYKSHADKERERRERQLRAQQREEVRQKRRDEERRKRAAKENWLKNYRATTPTREGFWGRFIDWWQERRAWAKHTADYGDEGFPLTTRAHQD